LISQARIIHKKDTLTIKKVKSQTVIITVRSVEIMGWRREDLDSETPAAIVWPGSASWPHGDERTSSRDSRVLGFERTSPPGNRYINIADQKGTRDPYSARPPSIDAYPSVHVRIRARALKEIAGSEQNRAETGFTRKVSRRTRRRTRPVDRLPSESCLSE
jgi:hypothetical protein